MTTNPVHRVIETVWRTESARVIASLVRLLRSIDLAEELAQDALLAALEHWPREGVPDNPGAWLMTAARHRAIDRMRRDQLGERKFDEHSRTLDTADEGRNDPATLADEEIGDDLLRLVFAACHPRLPTDARIALTLRLLGGLATDEIARAFLVSEATMAQRIVRAKRVLASEAIPFEIPRGHELDARLASVLDVIYLIFNEGYAATTGDDWTRPTLCDDALRLGRVLAGLMPRQAEIHGLVALMEIQASRMAARYGPDGVPILLADQDRRRWDSLQIRRGLASLAHAQKLGGTLGAFTLQAAIAACHARARSAAETDWTRIASLYAVLARTTPSPVIELNRAVAVAMASGPQAGLDLTEALLAEPALANYHHLPGVRGDFLVRLGRRAEARAEFERAASLTRNAREQALLRARAQACAD